MNREDFVKRGERKVDFLKWYRLVSRWACRENDIQIADLELLFYLDPLKYFTRPDFKEGIVYYGWDRQRFYRLQREGWIEKVHSGTGVKGGHNKYAVSRKGKLLINKIYRILIEQESFPENARNGVIKKKKTYMDKVYNKAIQNFNKKRES